MKKVRLVIIALAAGWLLAGGGAQAEPPPQKALGFEDPSVTRHGARLRLTSSTWDYLKLTLRDTFKEWDVRGGSGFNLIIDSGYDFTTHSAGPIRTTPFTQKYGSFYAKSRPSNERCCGDWANCNRNCRTCGSWCQNGGWTDCNAGGYELDSRSGWVQCRKPGYNTSDMPVVDWRCRSNFNEYGFYIPAPGGDSAGGGICGSAPVSADFNQFQVCTNRYRYDTGGGKPTGSWCTGSPVSYGIGDFHYNARIFLFPNMRQESVAYDPVDGWDPTLGGTIRRGPYTGYFSPYRSRVYDTDYNCQTQSPSCYNGGQCCNVWCLGCGSWAPCGTTTIQEVSCPGSTTSFSWRSYVKMPPQSTGSYSPSWAYNETRGTYFRPGDDTSVYLNIYEMQIQSADRSSYRPTSCLRDKIYTGLVGGVPNYLQESQKVHNCMRPKMYWYQDPLYPTKSEWRACDPFDTWNSDGTLNPDNDDAKWIYPGNPNSGGYGSPGRCGRQRCTWGNCVNHPTAGVWAWAPGSYTSNLNDIYSDDDGSGRGTGWYGLKLDYLNLNPGSNRIDVRFRGKDVRIEMGTALDFQAGWPFDDPQSTAFATGRVRLSSLVVDASIFLYSIDDKSCDRNYPASCGGLWSGINDEGVMTSGTINPDKLIVDAVITGVSINPESPWYNGQSSCLIDVFGCVVSISDVLNFSFVRDMIIPELEGAIQDALKGALGDITAVVPNLNGILGNPIDLGTVLVDTGIFLSGNPNDYQLVNPPDAYPRKWPVYIKEGPTTTRRLVDMQMSVGFKPIAFRPMGANGVMDVDNNVPPLAGSVYGVPELWRASTKGPSGDCPHSGSASSPDTCPGGTYTNGPGCSAAPHYAFKLESGQQDDFEYCRGRPNSTTDAWYYDPKTNNRIYLAQGEIVPHFWKGPLPEDKKPPSWCTIASPAVLMAGASASDFNSLYPISRWLSFHGTLDNPPASSGLIDAGRNTIGTWDRMPAYSVLKQGTDSFDGNQGTLDSATIPYDFSMHIHQRTFTQFLQTLFGSGLACLEFSSKTPEGEDSMWKSLLATDRFAAFLPEIQTLFPNSYVKVRIMPTKTPHVRVGMGNLSFTPESRIKDPVNGALPVSNEPYTLSAALPDMQVQVLVEDKQTGTDVSILTFNWNTVVGFYAKAVRQCYHLDPLATDPECTSPFTNVRTVSGYYELFFDINGQQIINGKKTGNNQLGAAWENNGRDGFSTGRFTRADFVCPGCSPSIPAGQAMFEVTQSYCDVSDRCDMLGLAQSIPTILSSTIQAFLVSRFSFYNLTIDFLYVGPDGPNDDGIGTAKAYPFNRINGDYLGIYARFLGNLNVFGLLEAAAFLAPKSTGRFEPQAKIEGVQDMQFVNSSTPEFPIDLRAVPLEGDPDPVVSYTYSIDDGLWHTPVDWDVLQLPRLTEGEHKLTLRTLQDSKHGAAANLTPTVLKFVVDTVAPDVKIPPSKKGVFGTTATITAKDLQTPKDRLTVEYSIDDGDWQAASDLEVSLGHLRGGKHVLRARATDLAGNTGEAARVIVIDADGRWGCQSSSAGASPLIWLLILFIAYSGRRAFRRK